MFLRSKGSHYLNYHHNVHSAKVWFHVWKWVIMVPQSCGDNICFDAGFQGIKCDTTEHLKEKEADEDGAFSV